MNTYFITHLLTVKNAFCITLTLGSENTALLRLINLLPIKKCFLQEPLKTLPSLYCEHCENSMVFFVFYKDLWVFAVGRTRRNQSINQ